MDDIHRAASRGAARRAAAGQDSRLASALGLTRRARRALERQPFDCRCGARVRAKNYQRHLARCQQLRDVHARVAAKLAPEAPEADEKATAPAA